MMAALTLAGPAHAAPGARKADAPPSAPPVSKKATTLALSPGTATYGGKAAVRAVLQVRETPVAGRVIGLELNGKPLCGARSLPVCPATDGNGVVEFEFSPGAAAGGYEDGIYATFGGDATHGPSSATASLQISPAPLTISAKGGTRVYGAPTPKLDSTFEGFVGGEGPGVLAGELACTTPATAASPVGRYPVTCAGLSSGNYDIRFADGTLDITPAPLTVSAKPATKQYGAELPELGAEFQGWVAEDGVAELSGELRCETDATALSPVGTHAVRCTGLSSPNYELRYIEGTLAVTPAPLTVIAANAEKRYGAELPAFGVDYRGFVGDDRPDVVKGSPSCTTPASPTSAVGEYPIICAGLAADNYQLTYEQGKLTVTPAPLTVSAPHLTKLYGAPLPPMNASLEGLVGQDDRSRLGGELRCVTTATEAEKTGSYPVTCSGLQSPNYEISYRPGELSIQPAPLTIKADDQRAVYGSAHPTFTASFQGFVLGEDAKSLQGELRCTADAGKDPGDYAIRCEGLSSANYAVQYAPGVLHITKAPLTVTANDKKKTYAEALPGFDAAYEGFVAGEGPDSLKGTLACATDATPTSRVGDYPIRCGGLESEHYQFTYREGRLTVTPAPPVVRWDTPAEIVYGEALSEKQLSARADVPGTFRYAPAAGTRLPAGTKLPLRAEFVPQDTVNYEGATAETHIDVRKADPQVTWHPPAPIVYGTPLGEAHLQASTNVAGAWSYTPAAGTVLSAGADQPLRAQFVPQDTANYNDAAAQTAITVLKATPRLEWQTPPAVAYGAPLDEGRLSARADVPGRWTYTPGGGALLEVGPDHRLQAQFTPEDEANYLPGTVETTLNVLPAGTTTTITGHWLEPSLTGQPVTVSFRVTPATNAGVAPQGRVTVSNGNESCSASLETGQCALPLARAGRQPLTARYAGDPHYGESEGTAQHQVEAAQTSVDLHADRDHSTYGELLALTAKVAVSYPGAGQPTGTVEFYDDAKLLGSATLDGQGIAKLSLDILGAGARSLSAKYLGDADFKASGSVTVKHAVAPAEVEPAVSVVPATQQYSDTVTLTASLPRERPGSRSPVGPNSGVTFKLGRMELGRCTLAPQNDVYTCSVTRELTAPRLGYFGELLPGAEPKVIQAQFDNIIEDFKLTREATATLVITPEDAHVDYTGPLLAWTTFRDSVTAAVELSASVQDASLVESAGDATPGDVKRSAISFVNLNDDATLANALAVTAADDGRTGEVRYRWNADLAACGEPPCGKVYALGIAAGDHYRRVASRAEAVLTVAQPGDRALAGAGVIKPSYAGEMQPADTPSHIGFHVNYGVGPERARGRLIALVRSPTALAADCAGPGIHTYLISGDTVRDVTVDMVHADIDAPPRASFRGSARILDVTDAQRTCVVDNTAAFAVRLTDGSANSKADALGFALWNSAEKLLLATGWDGSQPLEQSISAGDMVVR